MVRFMVRMMRMMMMRMRMRRRRMRMRIMRMNSSLCELAQSKRTGACYKTYFLRVIHRKNAGPQFLARHFVRACTVETHMDMSQEPF